MKPYVWRQAILCSGLRPTTRHVLLTLGCHINGPDESAYPSTRLLAEETGLSERAVITNLHEAAAAGWISIKRRQMAGQQWARNEYFPSIPEGALAIKGTEPASAPKEEKALNVAANDTEARSAPKEKALNLTTEGAEPSNKGTELSGIEALNQLQSNRPIEQTKEQTKKQNTSPKNRGDEKYSAIDALSALGVDRQIAKDWLAVRKLKGSAPTKTAIDKVLQNIFVAGMSANDGLRICCERSWAGFNKAWLESDVRATNQARAGPTSKNDRTGAAAAVFGTAQDSKGLIDVN